MSRALHAAALSAWLLLCAVLLLRYWWLAPAIGVTPWLASLITLTPLALLLPGLLAGRAYTFALGGFLALPYFAFGVDSLYQPGWSRALGVAEVTASLLLFFSCALYPRSVRRRV